MPLCGLVDEARISRGVVQMAELLRADPLNADAPQWPTTALVEGYWRFEGRTMTIPDVSGNALDG